MSRFDLRRVAEYIRRAETEELLDRVTIYRNGMEPAALDLMEGELDRRGLTREEITSYGEDRWQSAIRLPDGTARRCSFCNRPAIMEGRGWHRLFGVIPIYPRVFAYCKTHGPKGMNDANPPAESAS